MCFEWFPGRFPSEIQAEIDRLPSGFVDEMIESFTYAKAKSTYDANPKATGAARDVVKAIEFGFAEEEMRARERE